MARQPSLKPLEPSGFFPNGMSVRPLVPGTVARKSLKDDPHLHTGKPTKNYKWTQAAGVVAVATGDPYAATALALAPEPYAATFPFEITKKNLDRGQESYKVFCSMCHGQAGYGDGMVALRGFTKPPSYHIPRLQQANAGYFFEVITNGHGAMPEHGYLIPAKERWEIVAYLRALQLSQNMKFADLNEEQKKRLLSKGGASP